MAACALRGSILLAAGLLASTAGAQPHRGGIEREIRPLGLSADGQTAALEIVEKGRPRSAEVQIFDLARGESVKRFFLGGGPARAGRWKAAKSGLAERGIELSSPKRLPELRSKRGQQVQQVFSLTMLRAELLSVGMPSSIPEEGERHFDIVLRRGAIRATVAGDVFARGATSAREPSPLRLRGLYSAPDRRRLLAVGSAPEHCLAFEIEALRSLVERADNPPGFDPQGLQHGEWTWMTRDGRQAARGRFAHGKLDGPFVWLDEQGRKQAEVEYAHGAARGAYTYYEKGVRHHRGAYRQGKRHGLWTYWYAGGATAMESEFSLGVRHGRHAEWTERGEKRAEGRYRHGKRHGTWLVYHNNGKKRSRTDYRDGVAHGQFCGWNEAGTQTYSGQMRDDKKHGTWRWWYKDGKPKEQTDFQRGEKNGPSTTWHRSGTKREQGAYLAGEKHGHWKEWSRAGTLHMEADFRKGKVHGTCKRYHPNSKLGERSGYRGGKRHGRCVRWSPEGVKIEQSDYRDGKLHGKRRKWNTRGELVEESTYRAGRKIAPAAGKR
ncbi:MAG: hypothetical protein JXR96_20980 [Deltaproteobacteria bacterium]|nr:hypothetical protein [Deltaproteobacteria bacterium]